MKRTFISLSLVLVGIIPTFSQTVAPSKVAQNNAIVTPATKGPPAAKIYTEGDTVYITRTGKKFHRAGCPSLRYSAIAMKRWEAIAKGYAPCNICNP
jgi:hypothetical protein